MTTMIDDGWTYTISITSAASLSCHWCGVSLAMATTVTYLNGSLPCCDLCILKANTK